MGNIGGRVYYTFDTGRALIMPAVHASYGHEFLRGGQTVTSRLAQGSSPFTIETPSPDRNFVLVRRGGLDVPAKRCVPQHRLQRPDRHGQVHRPQRQRRSEDDVLTITPGKPCSQVLQRSIVPIPGSSLS